MNWRLVIQNILNSCSSLSGYEFTVFAKSVMGNIGDGYRGISFSGIATICKNKLDFMFHEVDVVSGAVLAANMSHSSGNVLQTIINLYVP